MPEFHASGEMAGLGFFFLSNVRNASSGGLLHNGPDILDEMALERILGTVRAKDGWRRLKSRGQVSPKHPGRSHSCRRRVFFGCSSMVEHAAVNRTAAGSSPATRAKGQVK